MKPSLSYDLEPLHRFAKAISQNYQTDVGILGKKDHRNGKADSNATIGLVHEFGSFKHNIPRRSFLQMPLAFKANEIIMDVGKTALKLLAKGDYRQIFVNLGVRAEEAIQEAFDTSGWGSWAPNKVKTILRKTPKRLKAALMKAGQAITGKPLINTSQLRRGVTHRVKELK